MENKQKNLYKQLQDGYSETMWYDWFCNDSSLKAKGETLLKKVHKITFSKKFDMTNTYVFFKNCCPMNGSTYDQFKVCDLETKNVLYCVTPRSGHTSMHGQAEVWGHENEFKEALYVGDWKGLVAFFMEGN